MGFDERKNDCTPERLQAIKVGLEQMLEILRQVGKGDPTSLATQLNNIYNSINSRCFIDVGGDILFHLDRLIGFMGRGSNGRIVRETKDRLIQLIEELIPRLDDPDNFNSGPRQSEQSQSSSSSSRSSTMLFPGNKYLNLSNANQFPDVKSKYRELSLVYHPDKCPNDKTPGFTKQQCEDEFKILNNEYNAIKEKLGVSGGKRRARKNKTRKGKNSRRKSKKNSRRYRR
jgi:hypothetical protein